MHTHARMHTPALGWVLFPACHHPMCLAVTQWPRLARTFCSATDDFKLCSSFPVNIWAWRGSCWQSILNRQKHRQLPALVIGVWLRGVLSCRTKSLTCGTWYYLWVDSGEGNGNAFQYSCLENRMDRGIWRTIVHVVTRVGHGLVTKPPPRGR